MIDELDSHYMDTVQEEMPYFIHEESLDVLFTNFRKLSDWYNETIFLFFF